MTSRFPFLLLFWLCCSAFCSLSFEEEKLAGMKRKFYQELSIATEPKFQEIFRESESEEPLSAATTFESLAASDTARGLTPSAKSSPLYSGVSRISDEQQTIRSEAAHAQVDSAATASLSNERIDTAVSGDEVAANTDDEPSLEELIDLEGKCVETLQNSGQLSESVLVYDCDTYSLLDEPLDQEKLPLELDSLNAWRLNFDDGSFDEEETFMRLRIGDIWNQIEERVRQDGTPSDQIINSFSVDWPVSGKIPVKKPLSHVAIGIRFSAFSALLSRNYDMLNSFIAFGVDINKPVMAFDGDYYGSFLHFALIQKNPAPLNIIQLLLESGALVNLLDSDGDTALIIAIRTSTPEVIKLLLQHGANPNLRSAMSNYASLLSYAAFYNRVDVMQVLLESGQVDVNEIDFQGRHVLDLILLRRSLPAFRLILSCPVLVLPVGRVIGIIQVISAPVFYYFLEPFCAYLLESLSEQKDQLLRLFLSLIERGMLDALREFLRLGFDLNFVIFNAQGKRIDVIGYAAIHNQVDVLKLFNELKFPLNLPIDRRTPIMLTIAPSAIEAFRYLVSFESLDKLHLVLRMLCKLDRPEFVEALMESNPEAIYSLRVNDDGILQLACRYCAIKVVQLLMQKYGFALTEREVEITSNQEIANLAKLK